MADFEADAYPQGIVELGFLDHVGGVVFCCVVEGFQVVVGEEREGLGGLSISKAPNKADKEAPGFARAANAKLPKEENCIKAQRPNTPLRCNAGIICSYLVPRKKGLSRVSDGGAAREVARVRSLFLSGRKSGKWRARAIRRRRWRRSIDQMKRSAFDEYKARREKESRDKKRGDVEQRRRCRGQALGIDEGLLLRRKGGCSE